MTVRKVSAMQACTYDRRSQPRLEAAIPIRVQGIDAVGQAYVDATTALDVSRRGICFRNERELPVFAPVSVEILCACPNGHEGPHFFAEAIVVRTIQESQDSYRVAVRFMGATLPMYCSESA